MITIRIMISDYDYLFLNVNRTFFRSGTTKSYFADSVISVLTDKGTVISVLTDKGAVISVLTDKRAPLSLFSRN